MVVVCYDMYIYVFLKFSMAWKQKTRLDTVCVVYGGRNFLLESSRLN